MASLDRIGRHGFKRWHERQLIESHAWLVTCFLAIIAVASGIEIFGNPVAGSRATGALLMLGGIAVALFAWRRYSSMLGIALRLSERAVCPLCRRYSRFRILDYGPKPFPDGIDIDLELLREKVWLRAKCGDCGWTWSL